MNRIGKLMCIAALSVAGATNSAWAQDGSAVAMMCCGMGGQQSGSMQQPTQGQSGQMGSPMMNDNMNRMSPSQPMQPQPAPPGGMGMMDDMRRMQQGQQMPGMTSNGVDMMDRLDGRLAFLRAEIGVTDAQAALWNQFARSIREGRDHLMEARRLLAGPMSDPSPAVQLERYEKHLGARLEALRAARISFQQLFAVLDEGQKLVANQLLIPFLATF